MLYKSIKYLIINFFRLLKYSFIVNTLKTIKNSFLLRKHWNPDSESYSIRSSPKIVLKWLNHLWELGPVISTPRGFFFLSVSRKRLQSTSMSILGGGSLPFLRKCLTSFCIFMYKCLQGSCSWTLSGNLMSEYYIWAHLLNCLTSDELCMPELRPTYSSRVRWHCLPWSVIISNKVVSELVSENQAHGVFIMVHPPWSYTECNISCIDFAFLIKILVLA